MGPKPQQQQYQAYAVATQTMARTKQIVMLYDGAIRFVQQAKEAIDNKRIEDRYKMLTKASEIIMGLQGCLDFDKGGDIGRILYGFYSLIDSRIFSIHRTNSMETCDEVIADLKKMRDVWYDIDHDTSSTSDTSSVAVSSERPSEEKPASPGTAPAIILSA